MKHTEHAVVEARCLKGHMRTIHPNEIAKGDHPVCQVDGCYKIMLPVEARSCFCDWLDRKGDD